MEYVRIGNRTITTAERARLTPEQIQKMKDDGDAANQKRLANMRASGEFMPQKMTIDVTPKGIAARKAAIVAEEAKLAAETQAISEDLGPEKAAFVTEAETPAEIKKSKGKKAVAIAS